MENLFKVIAKHISVGDEMTFSTPSYYLKIFKNRAEELPEWIPTDGGTFRIHSYCDMIGETATPNDPNATFIDPLEADNCLNKIITFRASALPMAATGHNGKNESLISASMSIFLGFYDENQVEIKIKNLKHPIEMWVNRDKKTEIPDFETVNATSRNNSGEYPFIPFIFTNMSINSSVHIQIKPAVKQIGYRVCLRFGATPRWEILNNKKYGWNFDDCQVLCPPNRNILLFFFNSIQRKIYFLYLAKQNEPGDLVYSERDGDYYSYYNNMAASFGHTGIVAYGISELTVDDIKKWCDSTKNEDTKLKSNTQSDDINRNKKLKPEDLPRNDIDENKKMKFTANFGIRVFISGCYFYEPTTGKWSSIGVEIDNQTNLTKAHCHSSHLTEFAAGLLLTPNFIDFAVEYVDEILKRNPTIYATVLSLVGFYIIFALVARYWDREDLKSVGVTPLLDDSSNERYLYEIIVHTGSRPESACDSKVFKFNLQTSKLLVVIDLILGENCNNR
jgi:hypothetical protein